MSRIGKKPIDIPEKTEVTIRDGGMLSVKGPGGELSRTFRPLISISVKDNTVVLAPEGDDTLTRALWGTYASHITNMIKGVNEPFEKKLVIEGIGYRAEISGNELVLSVGYSHQVKIPVPQSLTVAVEKNVITIRGIDKEEVGAFAAMVRAKKKPEPYKGKGIRYDDEVVRRKQGKRAVT